MADIYLDTNVVNLLVDDVYAGPLLDYLARSRHRLIVSQYVVSECFATPDAERRQKLLDALRSLLPRLKVLANTKEVLQQSIKFYARGLPWEMGYMDPFDGDFVSALATGDLEVLNDPLEHRANVKATNDNLASVRADARCMFRDELDPTLLYRKRRHFLASMMEHPDRLEDLVFRGRLVEFEVQERLRGRLIEVFLKVPPWQVFYVGEALNLFRAAMLEKRFGRKHVPNALDTLQLVYLAMVDEFVTNDGPFYRLVKATRRLCGLPRRREVLTYTEFRDRRLIEMTTT